MDWIITNPLDAFVLAWSIGLKYSTLACLIIAFWGFIALRTRNANKRKVITAPDVWKPGWEEPG